MGRGEDGVDGGVVARGSWVTAVDVAYESGNAKDRAEFRIPCPGLCTYFTFVPILLVAEAN